MKANNNFKNFYTLFFSIFFIISCSSTPGNPAPPPKKINYKNVLAPNYQKIKINYLYINRTVIELKLLTGVSSKAGEMSKLLEQSLKKNKKENSSKRVLKKLNEMKTCSLKIKNAAANNNFNSTLTLVNEWLKYKSIFTK